LLHWSPSICHTIVSHAQAPSPLLSPSTRNIDWKIDSKANCDEAIKRMTAGRIGCLGVTDPSGKVVGVVSERDFINKVAFLEKDARSTPVSEICTYGPANLVKVKLGDPIDRCMEKMLGRDIRHLLITEDTDSSQVIGMISIKDVVKCSLARSEAKMERLAMIVQTQDMMKFQI